MPKSPARKAKTARPSSSHAPSRGPPRDFDGFPIVGIGASAGGLDACRSFLDALPADCGMAFILVQHLDPTHESMMVDLLTGHTSMTVLQATDGMPHRSEIPSTSFRPEHISPLNTALYTCQNPMRAMARVCRLISY